MATKQHSLRTRQMRAALAQIPDIHPEHVHGFAAFSEAADRIAELTRELDIQRQNQIDAFDTILSAAQASLAPGEKLPVSLTQFPITA